MAWSRTASNAAVVRATHTAAVLLRHPRLVLPTAVKWRRAPDSEHTYPTAVPGTWCNKSYVQVPGIYALSHHQFPLLLLGHEPLEDHHSLSQEAIVVIRIAAHRFPRCCPCYRCCCCRCFRGDRCCRDLFLNFMRCRATAVRVATAAAVVATAADVAFTAKLSTSFTR